MAGSCWPTGGAVDVADASAGTLPSDALAALARFDEVDRVSPVPSTGRPR
jgi:hypothetical protein